MRFVSLVAFVSAAAILLGGSVAQAQKASVVPSKAVARIAVFSHPGFPRYGMSPLVVPAQIAEELRAVGFEADLLDVDALAKPERMNAQRYAAVILPYGNTYPQEAFPNLQRFHKAGGSLITTGIPFTHAAAQRAARDWSASPEWGQAVMLAPGKGQQAGTNAIQLNVRPDGWTGISSRQFPVRPGDVVAVSVALKQTAAQPPKAGADQGKEDHLYIRFFDSSGKYIEQQGPLLNPKPDAWQTVRGSATVPQTAIFADLSVQMQRPGRQFLASDFTASVNAMPVKLVNEDLSKRGEEFQDLGHDVAPSLWGPGGIGIGSFDGPGDTKKPAPYSIAPGDPLRLAALFGGKNVGQGQPAPQWLDAKTVPAGVKIIPAIGEPGRPLVALLVHTNDAFKGAVDAWTYRFPGGEREDYDNRQLITRATVAALAKKGVLSESQKTVAFRNLDALPKPKIYANLTLPTPKRSYTTFQPKMPPLSRHLYVADVRKLKPDEKLMLISLQGIVNRKQPRIYLIFDNDDQLWLDELQKQKHTDEPLIVLDPWSLLDTFHTEYKGAVVCDPKVYVSPCVAVSMAGAFDLVVAKDPDLAVHHKVPVKIDLRGRFKDDVAALRYLHTDLLPHLDPYLTCSLDPAVYDKGGLDQVIAARGSAFWITGPKAQNLPGANQVGEMEEVRTLFTKMPMGAVVRGFWWHGDEIGLQESDGVALGSRFGKITLVSDLITNLSVHSGVVAEKMVQKPRQPAPPLDRSKVYICFTMSDGDNLCTWRGYFRRYFEDPVRGSFPVGWGMGPSIIDLAPGWAQWFYDKATPNDEFICDVSGVAYMYPPSWGTALKDRDAAFHYFYDRTQEYMGRMDMKTIRLMDVRANDIANVGKLLPGVEFLMPDYGHDGPEIYSELTYTLPTGQPVFRAATNGSGPENLANQIRKRAGKARPACLNVFIWNWGSKLGDLKKTLEILGPEYVAVTPSQLNHLYKEAQKPQTQAASNALVPTRPIQR